MIAGNYTCLDLVGFITLRFKLAGQTLLHEIGVVPALPMDIIIEAELLRHLECTITNEQAGGIALSLANLPATDARIIPNSCEDR